MYFFDYQELFCSSPMLFIIIIIVFYWRPESGSPVRSFAPKMMKTGYLISCKTGELITLHKNVLPTDARLFVLLFKNIKSVHYLDWNWREGARNFLSGGEGVVALREIRKCLF